MARQTGLGISTVSTIIKQLVDQGIVIEKGTRQQAMGRPSIMLSVNPTYALAVGAKLNPDNLTAVLTDLDSNVLASATTHLDYVTPDGVARAFKTLLPRLLKKARLPKWRIAGAGLALTGLVDGKRGVCLQSTVLGWKDAPIGTVLSRALDMPVSIENDANAVAIGEGYKGEAQLARNLVVLSIGHGIGAGIILDGRLYIGAIGTAGELGHVTIERNGPKCRCGKRGCLEAIASVPAVIRQAKRYGLEVSALSDLEAHAATGNPDARRIWLRVTSAIGVALSHVVNLLNPELVIVAGSDTRLGANFAKRLSDELAMHTLPLLPKLPKLVVRDEQPDVWARGAASGAAQAFFSEGRWEQAAQRSAGPEGAASLGRA